MEMHVKCSFRGQSKCQEGVGPARRHFAEYPNVPVLSVHKLVVVEGPCRDYHEIFVNEQLLNVRVRHEGVLSCEGWGLPNDPVVLVDTVSIS